MVCLERVESLGLVLTARCNLRCSYCYQNTKKALSMDWDVVRASVDLALGSTRPRVNLLFSGGEPLLEFPTIRRAVEYANGECPQDKTINYRLITNGLLLTADVAAFLAGHSFDLQLSLDGVKEAQDLRAEDTFHVLDRLLNRLKQDHPDFFRRRLKVTVTLIPPAIEHLADSVDYLLGKGVRQIAISPSITHHPDWQDENLDLLDAQFARVFDSCLRHERETGEIPLLLFRKDVQHWPGIGTGRTMCGVMRGEALVVDVDGKVHGCAMFASSYQDFPSDFLRSRVDDMSMGDVRDPELPSRLTDFPNAVRRAEIFHRKEDKYSSYGKCGDCQYFSLCGVCPMSIGYVPNNSDPDRVPDFQCAFTLTYMKYRDRFPSQWPLPNNSKHRG